MTFSIVARDPATGALGVAVQSAIFGSGAVVPFARPGVGAVASQAIAEPSYGPTCLDAIAEGADAAKALELAKAADQAAFLRQVGVVAADGSASAFTGDFCIDHCGHVVGDGFAAQANMMSSPHVVPAMAAAFEESTGPLARRLLAALDAAQAAGGDARGVMSASIVVVGGERTDQWWNRALDVRVDRSADPLGELHRLLDGAEAVAYFGTAVDKLFGGDPAGALADVEAGLLLAPDDENLAFVRAGALFASGDPHGGQVLRDLIAARPTWATVVRSFAAKGLMRLPQQLSIDDLLEGADV